QVDRVHLAQEGERGTGAELLRAGHEGPDVLGQAAAAVAEPGAQEGRADARVGAEDLRQVPHVSPGSLADLGHRVDERDLRGQECVGGRLGQLGGFQAGGDERGAARERPRVQLPEYLPGPAGGAAYSGRSTCPARREVTPTKIRSGARVSATALPSRRNSGFHASSAPGQAWLSSAASRRAVPTGTVDLPTTRHGRSSSGASAATQACT